MVVEAQIHLIQKRNALDTPAHPVDLGVQVIEALIALRGLVLVQQGVALFLEQAQPAAAGRRERAPAHGRLAHGAHDVDLRRQAVTDDAAVAAVKRAAALQVPFDQVGQLQVFEQEVEKFPLVDFERELVGAFAGIAGVPATGTAFAAGGLLDPVAGLKLPVARMHHVAAPAGTVMKARLGQILFGNADALALLHIGNRAAAHRLVHRFTNVAPVTLQKALPVHRTLVLPVETPVNDITHTALHYENSPRAINYSLLTINCLFIAPYAPANTTPTTTAPVSRCTRGPSFA